MLRMRTKPSRKVVSALRARPRASLGSKHAQHASSDSNQLKSIP